MWLNSTQVQSLTGLSWGQINNMAKSGWLGAVKSGHHWMFDSDEVNAYIQIRSTVLSTSQTAKILNAKYSTVQGWAKMGRFGAHKLWGRFFFDAKQVYSYRDLRAGYCTVREAAKILKVSRKTVIQRVQAGFYGAIRDGSDQRGSEQGRWLLRRDMVDPRLRR